MSNKLILKLDHILFIFGHISNRFETYLNIWMVKAAAVRCHQGKTLHVSQIVNAVANYVLDEWHKTWFRLTCNYHLRF